MKYTLYCQLTCNKEGAPLVVLNGLPAYHDVTMTPKQLKKLADALSRFADTSERGGIGEVEQDYAVSDYSQTLAAIED